MIQTIRKLTGIIFALALMLAGSDAMAQQKIVRTASIPTLSEWGIIILSGLLAFAAISALRRRRQ